MKWIVLEENPKPDNYIAVVVADNDMKLKLERQAHSVFYDGDMALARARVLREQFGVRMIRLFHMDGHSSTAS